MSRIIHRVLVADDEPRNRSQYAALVLEGSPRAEPNLSSPILPMVSTVRSGEEALVALQDARERSESFDVLVTDLFMPDPRAGLWLIGHLREKGFTPEDLEVILLSRHDDVRNVEQEIRSVAERWGDGDQERLTCVLRPDFAPDSSTENARHTEEFLDAVWRGIWAKLDRRFRQTLIPDLPSAELHGNLTGFGTAKGDAVFHTIDDQLTTRIDGLLSQVAPTGVSVLIEGETGTGKDVLGRLIHDRSGAQHLEALNCAAIPTELFESELFGHEKGAFTSATQVKRGRVEVENATLFLDEISELSLRHQSKLLRFLDRGEYNRVGSTRTRTSSARIVAASNRLLEEEVRMKRFRDDLWYRLSVEKIHIPPLRERSGDISGLALLFWKSEQKRDKLPKRLEEWEPTALASLKSKPWPENVRGVLNFIKRLKVRHPPGLLVTAQALAAADDDGMVDSFDPSEIDTFNRYAQHRGFFTAIQTIVRAGGTPRVKDILDCFVENESDFFDRLESDPSKRQEKARNMWREHREICSICRKLATWS